MITVQEKSDPKTVEAMSVEFKLLRRQIEKLAEENVELVKKVAALQISKRPK